MTPATSQRQQQANSAAAAAHQKDQKQATAYAKEQDSEAANDKQQDSAATGPLSLLIKNLPAKLTSEDHLALLQRCLESGSVSAFDHQEDQQQIVVKFINNQYASSCFSKLTKQPLKLKNGHTFAVSLMQNGSEVSADSAAKDGQKCTESAADKNGSMNGGTCEEPESSTAKRAKESMHDEEELDYGGVVDGNDEENGGGQGTDSAAKKDADDNDDWLYGNDNDAVQSDKKSSHAAPASKPDRDSVRDHRRRITEISPVIHARNLPDKYSKNDFCKLIISFGKIKHCIFMKSQSFIEMDRVDDAKRMIEYCAAYPLYHLDRKIILQYSIHKKLEKSENHSENNRHIENTLSFLWNDIPPHDRTYLGYSVIVATVENMIYPVDLDAIHQIFSKFGRVLKVRMFEEHGQFKALIQMENPLVAREAVQHTDNQNIYSDANLLRTKLLKIKELIIKPGEKNSMDYTRSGSQHQQSYFLSKSNGSSRFNDSSMRNDSMSSTQSNSRYSSSNSSKTTVVLVSNLSNFNDNLEKKINHLFILFSTVGIVLKIKVMFKSPDRAFIEFDTPEQACNAVSLLNSVLLEGEKLSVNLSRINSLTFKPTDNEKYNKDFTNSRQHRFGGRDSRHLHNIFPPSSKLHLSNLHESTTKEDIVPLFEKHGTIELFTFMEKKHMAYLKFTNEAEAVKALIDLHGRVINGLTLKVSFAKQ